ncbi:ribonuclease T2 [Sarracenia purpurea var. burkii]
MKFNRSLILIIKLFFVSQCLAVLCVVVAEDFDFFYFVQQSGKPSEDFSIHGLWPNYNDGTYPSNCDRANSFDENEISDLTSRLEEDWPTLACPSGDGLKFWEHEWDKHGTCSENALDQHSYFQKALDLKYKANLLQALNTAGMYFDYFPKMFFLT